MVVRKVHNKRTLCKLGVSLGVLAALLSTCSVRSAYATVRITQLTPLVAMYDLSADGETAVGFCREPGQSARHCTIDVTDLTTRSLSAPGIAVGWT